jgi:hypothetical protein
MPPRSWLRPFLVIMLAILAIVVGYWTWDASTTPLKAREAQMYVNINLVKMALEQYATDHRGRYPRDGEVVEALATGNYLRLGQNPYAPPGTPARLVVDAAAVNDPTRPVAHAPGTLLYHSVAQHEVYTVLGVIEGPVGQQLLGLPPVTKP